jgi:hypothetical protein
VTPDQKVKEAQEPAYLFYKHWSKVNTVLTLGLPCWGLLLLFVYLIQSSMLAWAKTNVK